MRVGHVTVWAVVVRLLWCAARVHLPAVFVGDEELARGIGLYAVANHRVHG